MLGGRGAVETLSGEGYDEQALAPGVMLWFRRAPCTGW